MAQELTVTRKTLPKLTITERIWARGRLNSEERIESFEETSHANVELFYKARVLHNPDFEKVRGDSRLTNPDKEWKRL